MCDCLDKLFKHYDKEFPGGIQFTNTTTMANMKTGETREAPPPLRFKYYKCKDGKPTKKILHSFISENYCRYCGIKI